MEQPARKEEEKKIKRINFNSLKNDNCLLSHPCSTRNNIRRYFSTTKRSHPYKDEKKQTNIVHIYNCSRLALRCYLFLLKYTIQKKKRDHCMRL